MTEKSRKFKNAVYHEKYRGFDIVLEYDEMAESPIDGDWDMLGTMVCFSREYKLGHEQPKKSMEEYINDLSDSAGAWKEIESLSIEAKVEERAEGGWVILGKDSPDEYGTWESKWKAQQALNDQQEKIIYNEERIATIREKYLTQHYIILPLYIFDHSGISISTKAFSCLWDSGCVGIVYCTLERARKEFKEEGQDDTIQEEAKERMREEVHNYDVYLRGQVVEYCIYDSEGELVESCGGFFPDTKAPNEYEYAIDMAKDYITNYWEKVAHTKWTSEDSHEIFGEWVNGEWVELCE